ncbi:MAG: hypothetical protein IPN90_00410 [Elusimicrobia bacterium]|nr:hypothetical protein [Elusimicrobiota bacterium]
MTGGADGEEEVVEESLRADGEVIAEGVGEGLGEREDIGFVVLASLEIEAEVGEVHVLGAEVWEFLGTDTEGGHEEGHGVVAFAKGRGAVDGGEELLDLRPGEGLWAAIGAEDAGDGRRGAQLTAKWDFR